MSRISVVVARPDQSAVAPLLDYLRRCGLLVEDGTGGDVVVVLSATELPEDLESSLLGVNVPVLLIGPRPAESLADSAGVLVGRETPRHEIRVRPGPDAGQVAARLAGDLILGSDSFPLLDKVADDVAVLLTASVGLSEHPVATYRPSSRVGLITVGGSASTMTDPAYLRIVHRVVRHLLGEQDQPTVRVGILGYGAIGHEHSAAIAAVDGLALTAVCDPNPDRVSAARGMAPEIAGYSSAEDLLTAPDVDLVIVSTPPNAHAEWTLRALKAGKHVVVEKPLCITTAEADAQLGAAKERGLALAVYQNRRWDTDYLALKNVVRRGLVGEVFHCETFLGSYGHPCNYWHSDEKVSGGAIYDWGSHFLDWILDLMPQPVEWVSGAAHKRVWHDVTNADHSRVTIRFTDGAEAEFVHSDLAAAAKPKFYLLGTLGAVIGDWRRATVVSRNPVGLLAEDVLAHADSPARMRLLEADGTERLLALPPSPAQPFHRELADLLLSAAPMSVTPEGSRRTIAVMEAATRSIATGGALVAPA